MYKYLLFDENAVSRIVGNRKFQSIEYDCGNRVIQHVYGKLDSEAIEDIYIQHEEDGIIFVGKKTTENVNNDKHKVFCIDLDSCNLPCGGVDSGKSEKRNNRLTDADYLTLIQKSLRTALKIWNSQGFTASERVTGSKLVLFPFTDHRRIVIERDNKVERLRKRNIEYPLLAYKYTTDNGGDDIIERSILQKAGETYIDIRISCLQLLGREIVECNIETKHAMSQMTSDHIDKPKEDFVFRGYDVQYASLTRTQREIVDYDSADSPLRINGPAGTGKTISMIMRAYRLLSLYKEQNKEFKIIFFTHSNSAYKQALEIFKSYLYSDYYLDENSPQSIRIVSLLDYCKGMVRIKDEELLDSDAGNAKTIQLQLIGDALNYAEKSFIINTYMPILSPGLKQLFGDLSSPNFENICLLLFHEFGVQIKGRTDCTLDSYKDIKSIVNGLKCENDSDKEFVFRLFTEYQKILGQYQYFDVDDVILEALSRLNAPVWRRIRQEKGYDYIFVDEMHLFNINEQSVFHFLTRDYTKTRIPICFALDYSQAIGDRGDTSSDYIESAFGTVEKKEYQTVFRNSPAIVDFCASIAASGTLMFHAAFVNPYNSTLTNFTDQDERKADTPPQLYMLNNDDEMYAKLSLVLDEITRKIQCKKKSIAIISFDQKMTSSEGANVLSEKTSKPIEPIGNDNSLIDSYILATPYEINGLEFDAVVMIAVDEGRIPQTIGTSDISQHFIRYSAYNMLYLSASRAKYRLVLLGTKVNGRSSCLDHSIERGFLQEIS